MYSSELLSKQRRYNIGEYKNLNRLTANTVTLDYLNFGIDPSNINITYPKDLIGDGYSLILPNRSGVTNEFLGMGINNKLKWGNPNVINNVEFKYGTGLNTSVIDASYNKGDIIFPENYEITIKPTSSTSKLLIQFRCAYIGSFNADTAITFYVFKTINNIRTEVQEEANLGPLNATGTNRSQYVTSTIIESGTTDNIKISFAFAFNNILNIEAQVHQIGILGESDSPGFYQRSGYSGYKNSIIVTDFEGSGTSSTLFSKSHDNESIYYNLGTLFLGNNFNSSNTQNSNYSLVTDKIFSNHIDVSGNLIYNNKQLDKLTIPVNNSKQDFFQLLTEQPRIFKYINYSITSSKLSLKWSLEDLYPFNNDSLYINLYENNRKILPVINNIFFDLSYNNYYNTIKILDNNSIINSNNRYITEFFFTKLELENLTNIDDISLNFDIYIYGNNNSNQGILDSNKLQFNNLQFISSREPSQPILSNIITDPNSNKINGNIFFNNIELDDVNTALNMIIIDISYIVTDSLRSNTINNNDYNINYNSIIPNPPNNLNTSSFDSSFILENLFYGTKYNIQGRGQNNGNNNYSLYSNINRTEYTQIPNSFNNIYYSLNDKFNDEQRPIKNHNNDLDYIVYVNNNNLVLGINGNLEITKQSAVNTDISGYGKFIDNLSDIFTLDLSFNNSIYKYIANGWSIEDNVRNDFSNNLVITVDTNDVFIDDNKKKGFRKKITYSIKEINKNLLQASSNYQTLYINFNSSFNDYSSKNLSLNFVVDDLQHGPSYTTNNFIVERNIRYIYCCGKPSVKDFVIRFDLSLNNMNSQYKWVPSKFGEIQISNESLSQTNKTTLLIPDDNFLNASGEYNYNYSSGAIHFRKSNISDVGNIGIAGNINIAFGPGSNIQNLKELKYINHIINTINLYCDHNSFIKNNDKIDRLDDYVKTFYEISGNFDINNFTYNDITPYLYNNHQNAIKEHTLIYFDGKFRNYVNRKYIAIRKITNSKTDINDYYRNFKNYLNNFINDVKYILIYYNINSSKIIGVIKNQNNNVGFNSLSPWFSKNISNNRVNINNLDGVISNDEIIITETYTAEYYILFIY